MADKHIDIKAIDEHLRKVAKGDVGDPNVVAVRPPIFYGTGIPRIDYVLGGSSGHMGGLPCGHVTEIYGAQAVGKTSLVYRMIANAQRKHPDKINLLFDYEHTTDKNYIQKCGVQFDTNTLRIFRPATIEQGIERMFLFHKTGRLGIVCFDSLASMMPKADLERRQKSLEDNAGVASKARIMSDMMRFVISEISESETAISFINHEIANIQPAFSRFAPPKTTPGGNALKYYTSMRIELLYGRAVSSDKLKDFDGIDYKSSVGKTIELHVEKFKFGNPGGRVRYDLRHGEGIDILTPTIAFGMKTGAFTKLKMTHTIAGVDEKFVGESTFREYLVAHPELYMGVFEQMADSAEAMTEPLEAIEPSEIPEIEEVSLDE